MLILSKPMIIIHIVQEKRGKIKLYRELQNNKHTLLKWSFTL